jgi:hypothetical protein
MSEQKYVDFDAIIRADGTLVSDVKAREEGANCDVIRKIAQKMGTIVGDETTGPLCDPVRETH